MTVGAHKAAPPEQAAGNGSCACAALTAAAPAQAGVWWVRGTCHARPPLSQGPGAALNSPAGNSPTNTVPAGGGCSCSSGASAMCGSAGKINALMLGGVGGSPRDQIFRMDVCMSFFGTQSDQDSPPPPPPPPPRAQRTDSRQAGNTTNAWGATGRPRGALHVGVTHHEHESQSLRTAAHVQGRRRPLNARGPCTLHASHRTLFFATSEGGGGGSQGHGSLPGTGLPPRPLLWPPPHSHSRAASRLRRAACARHARRPSQARGGRGYGAPGGVLGGGVRALRRCPR
jgi:hypothetical protein